MRTTHFIIVLVSLVTLSIVCPGCSSDSSDPYGSTSTSPPAAPPNTVLMSGMTFSPVTLTVTVGTTVTWKNNDGALHTSTSDTGVWDSGKMAAGVSTVTTFNTPGTFTYHCFYHESMGMKGTVVVQ